MGVNTPVVASRFALATLPTPLVPARRPGVLLKRDDLTGFAAAGHKARQLELLLGDALAQGRDTLVTGGGPGSNWIAAAAVAAAVAELGCELVLHGTRPADTHPNLAVALATGAHVRFTGDPDRAAVDTAIGDVAAELESDGRRPYLVPRGGATALGAVAMALAAEELPTEELPNEELPEGPGTIVVATGSGGACAGLAVGAAARGWTVVGASVSRPLGEATAQVQGLADACAALLDRPSVTVRLVDARGPGFGIPSAEGEAAARIALRTEGLVLDPVYTAKAFAVLLRLADRGRSGPLGPRPLVFWHTGGLLSAAAHLAHS